MIELVGMGAFALILVGLLIYDRLELSRAERALELRRDSLEEGFASRERMWAEERRALLDRIQDPAAVQVARIRQEMAEMTNPDAPSDAEVDEQFAKTSGAAVAWDDDLALLVPGDEEA